MPEVKTATGREELVRMFVESHGVDQTIHALAIRGAKQCTAVISVLLRPEEVRDCEMEHYKLIRVVLEELKSAIEGKGG